jgi:hypothetical protein
MTTEQRYVVKLASGEWLTEDGEFTGHVKFALKTDMRDAVQIASRWPEQGAFPVRLRPSARELGAR